MVLLFHSPSLHRLKLETFILAFRLHSSVLRMYICSANNIFSHRQFTLLWCNFLLPQIPAPLGVDPDLSCEVYGAGREKKWKESLRFFIHIN